MKIKKNVAYELKLSAKFRKKFVAELQIKIELSADMDELRRLRKMQFGALRRVRTVRELHSLYLLANQRTIKRNHEMYAFIESIPTQLPCIDGQWTVYYEDAGGVQSYRIKKSEGGTGYSFSQRGSILHERKEKLRKFIVSKDFELGEQMRYLDYTLRTYWHRDILTMWWDALCADLQKTYKSDILVDHKIIVCIDGVSYDLDVKSHYGCGYTFKYNGTTAKTTISY